VDRSAFDEEMARNRLAYEGLREQIQREYAGKYVAMAFGRIVAVSPDFDQARKAVEQLTPAPTHALVFAAEDEPAFEPYEALHTAWA
jgi:hypothetical protein